MTDIENNCHNEKVDIQLNSLTEPIYPLFVYYVVDDRVDGMMQIDNEDYLYHSLEDFDTDDDGYVFDSVGRPVRLRVKIWENNKAIVVLEQDNKYLNKNLERISIPSEKVVVTYDFSDINTNGGFCSLTHCQNSQSYCL